jgi:hypothetical protein
LIALYWAGFYPTFLALTMSSLSYSCHHSVILYQNI